MSTEIISSPVCDRCKNIRDELYKGCLAFPKNFGIPEEIWRGANKHTSPYPGDGGVQFEPIDKNDLPRDDEVLPAEEGEGE